MHCVQYPQAPRFLAALVQLLLLALLLRAQPCQAFVHNDLSTTDWTLSNRNGSVNLPTKLPAYALGVLWQAGVIHDPLQR